MTRVLHVTESYGGGVAYAIEKYIENAPHVEHYILGSYRESGRPTGHPDNVLFTHLPKHPVQAVRAIRRAADSFRPDFVHAHSSIAGVLCRTSQLNRPTKTLVYTPHCYAFERKDISRGVQLLFRATERLLTRNTGVLAACSEREAALSRQLGHSMVCVIPNVASLQARHERALRSSPALVISAGGRLDPQKDPGYFLQLQQSLAPQLPEVKWRWLGGGNEAWARRLEQAGVEVTGWLSQAEYFDELLDSAVYLHTAQWEGFPMAVLEAVQLGAAVLVRPIAAFGEVPEMLHLTEASVRRLASADYGTPARLEAVTENLECWSQVLSANTDLRQADALRNLYVA